MADESHARHSSFLAAGTVLVVNGHQVLGTGLLAVAVYEWYSA